MVPGVFLIRRKDVAKTMIDTAYGYHGFERFRKRVLLILAYSKAI